jgi:hypothetical protein
LRRKNSPGEADSPGVLFLGLRLRYSSSNKLTVRVLLNV